MLREQKRLRPQGVGSDESLPAMALRLKRALGLFRSVTAGCGGSPLA